MAFLPKLFHGSSSSEGRPKYQYPPQTEKEIAEGITNALTYLPQKAAKEMGSDIDEAFEIGDTAISARQLFLHPIKTAKKAAHRWTISYAKKTLLATAEAEFIWKPRLDHLENVGDLTRGASVPVRDAKEVQEIKEAVYRWVSQPSIRSQDATFYGFDSPKLDSFGKPILDSRENQILTHITGVEEIKDRLNPKVWSALKMRRGWAEIAEFQSNPTSYIWRAAFGERGVWGKKAPLYNLTPQHWLGEPLSRALGKTTLGKGIATTKAAVQKKVRTPIRKAIQGVAGQTAKRVTKAAWTTAKTALKQLATKILGPAAVASISSAIGGALGTVGGPVGTVVGAIAAPLLTKLTEWTVKIACCSCALVATFIVVTFFSLFFGLGSALSPLVQRGGVEPEQPPLQITKSLQPGKIAKDGTTQIITYSLAYSYKDGQDSAKDVTIVDDYDETQTIEITNPSGGVLDNGSTLSWQLGDLPPGTVGTKTYQTKVRADTDKIVLNKATITGNVGGKTKSMSSVAVLIVGEPPGLPPSGWPVSTGCITQGPNAGYSHRGLEAVDITVPPAEPDGAREIFATHDGTVGVYYGGGPFPGLGNYVIVTSSSGTFTSLYGHFVSISVDNGDLVAPNQSLGIMGSSGHSTGLHLHYELRGQYKGQDLKMGTPYIPTNISNCTDATECNYCF